MKAAQQAAAVAANGGNPNHYFQRFLSNHDLERPATQFEAAAGPQLEAVLKQAATIFLTVPGMPVIYYGEEFGKKGKRDKYVGDEAWDHDEHIREPMSWFEELTFTGDQMSSWDIDYEATNAENAALALGAGVCTAPNPDYAYIKFMADGDLASWSAQKDDPASLFSHYKQLIAIRKANPVMTSLGAQLQTAQNTADVYEYTLTGNGQSLAVVLNRKSTDLVVTRPGPVTDLLSGTTAAQFTVPPHGALILEP
jgi:glycosidase